MSITHYCVDCDHFGDYWCNAHRWSVAPDDMSCGDFVEKCDAPIVNLPYIKDSGDRTEFATGAVRDMREGKGRCDLMPLDVVAHLLDDAVFDLIYMFQNTSDVEYLVYALKESNLYEKYETMLLEVAKHFEEGAKKYGENNWQKGIPTWCYIDSAIRHYLKHKRGDKDEPHDRAFVWNLMCCIWTVWNEENNKPEMKEG